MEPHAKNLPDGTVVADDRTAYIKNHPTTTAQWRGTNGGYFSDTNVDDYLADGATVLRLGYDGRGWAMREADRIAEIVNEWFQCLPTPAEQQRDRSTLIRDLVYEVERAALVDREAWNLLLNYAESGLEDDIDEDGEFAEDVYEEITEKAWEILRKLRNEHVGEGR